MHIFEPLPLGSYYHTYSSGKYLGTNFSMPKKSTYQKPCNRLTNVWNEGKWYVHSYNYHIYLQIPFVT